MDLWAAGCVIALCLVFLYRQVRTWQARIRAAHDATYAAIYDRVRHEYPDLDPAHLRLEARMRYDERDNGFRLVDYLRPAPTADPAPATAEQRRELSTERQYRAWVDSFLGASPASAEAALWPDAERDQQEGRP